MADSKLAQLNEAINEARRRHAPAEELHPLIIASAKEAERLGATEAAAEMRRIGASLVPLFGHRRPDKPPRKWWPF